MTTLQKSSKKKVSVVTEAIVSASDSEYESGSEGEQEFEGEFEGEFEEEDDASEEEEDNTDSTEEATDSNANEAEVKKNKKSKMESRADAKKLKLERQAHRPHNETVQEAKKLWERVRRRDLSAEQRAAPLAELYALLQGKFKEIIAKHDASRMIQTCVKYGNAEQRLMIAGELRGAYPSIAKSRYGKHIVKRLLQYCPSMRKAMVAEFRGQVAKLIRSVDAAAVLEEVYSEYANAREKNALLMEFYGPEFVLFKKTTDMAAIPTLSEVLTQKPECRERVMKAIRESLDALVNKGNLGHTVIHRLMLEYVQHEEVSRVQDWISTFDEKLVEILHTFEGARVVARCLAVASAKQKKTICKSLKQYIGKIAREEYGHQVLLVAFATVDDTVLTRGCILAELLKDLPAYLQDRHAQRLILFLLSGPTAGGTVLPAQAAQLVRDCEAAAVAAGTSKKDTPIRSAELRADLAGPIASLVLNSLEDSVFAQPAKCALLLEASLAVDEVTARIISDYLSRPEAYDSAEFRAFAKKFARRCSVEQAEDMLKAMKPVMKSIVEGEGAYVLMAMRATKPQVQIERFDTQNEHAMKLFATQ